MRTNINLSLAVTALLASAPAVAQQSDAMKLNVNLGFTSYVPYVTPALVAEKRGYFKEAGLTVNMHNGTGSAGAIQAVGVGNDDVAWVDLSTAASAIGQGNPVIAVSNIQPVGELGLISRKSEAVKTPMELKGKRVGSAPTGSDPLLLKVFMNANGLKPSDMDIQNVPGNARMPLLMNGSIDVISGQGFDYKARFTSMGMESYVMLYSDFGANMIGHGWVANATKLPSQGKAIKAFLAAYNKGLADTKANPKETCQIFLDTKVIEFTMAMCLEAQEGWFPLPNHPESAGKTVGYNPPKLWQESVERIAKFADIPAKPMTAYYTNDYLP
jgi:NitT/TauT family transport system substrate-binding protein